MKKITSFFVAVVSMLSLLTVVSAQPASAAFSECGGSSPDWRVARQIYNTSAAWKVSHRARLAAFEAAWVETNIKNHKSSRGLGPFLQGEFWGTKSQRLNVTYSTTTFLFGPSGTNFNGAAERDRHGWYTFATAGRIAADVQRAPANIRPRYDQAESCANRIIWHLATTNAGK